jgi:hypothetical protein
LRQGGKPFHQVSSVAVKMRQNAGVASLHSFLNQFLTKAKIG